MMSHITRRNVKPRLAMRLVLRYIDLGITFTIVTWLLSAVPLQPHAAERLRPAEITLFPPLIDGLGCPTTQPL